MTMTTSKTRKNHAPLNLLMGLVGLVAIFAVALGQAADAPAALNVPAVLALLASLTIMFLTRKSDEYTLGLWSSGANAAFAIIVLWMLFAPFFEGVYDGYMKASTGVETQLDFPTEGGSIFALLAFYIVFNFKRLTGAL